MLMLPKNLGLLAFARGGARRGVRARVRARICQLRTNGVNTNGVAAKVMILTDIWRPDPSGYLFLGGENSSGEKGPGDFGELWPIHKLRIGV